MFRGFPRSGLYDGAFNGDMQMFMRFFGFTVIIALIFSLALCAVFIVFRGLGLQRMAKRKNITHGWMGYVPLLNLYLLGQISNMPDKRRRSEITMLVLGILSFLSAAICVAYIVPLFQMAINAAVGTSRLGYDGAANMFSFAMAMLAASLFASGFAIALEVIKFIALNRVYKQFSPDNATVMTVFTVLAQVLIAPIYPFLLFAIRNNEIWPMGKPPKGFTGEYPPNIPKYVEYSYNNAPPAGEAPQDSEPAQQPPQENGNAYESQSASQDTYTAPLAQDTGLRPPPEPTVNVPEEPEGK